MIEVEHISKRFERSKEERKAQPELGNYAYAVSDVSFTCTSGSIFSLLGPNGAGKTTTMRMLSTLFTPDEGQIRIAGYSTRKQAKEARQQLGFLTGSAGLYARLTPEELVNYFGGMYGLKGEQLRKRREDLFERLNVTSFQHQRIGKLSTGMKQRVSICRTMIHDPQVVIFDEPTSGLDVISAESIIQLIRDCKNEGKTVIFSSHIMSEVELLSDELAILNKGKLIFNAPFSEFKSTMSTNSLTEEFIHRIQQNAVL